jgi:hypothetical protein
MGAATQHAVMKNAYKGVVGNCLAHIRGKKGRARIGFVCRSLSLVLQREAATAIELSPFSQIVADDTLHASHVRVCSSCTTVALPRLCTLYMT